MANAKQKKKRATLAASRSKLKDLHVSGSGIVAAVDVLAENHTRTKVFQHMQVAANSLRSPGNFNGGIDAMTIGQFIGYCACACRATSEEFIKDVKGKLTMKSVQKNPASADAAQTLQNAIKWDSLNKQVNGRSK